MRSWWCFIRMLFSSSLFSPALFYVSKNYTPPEAASERYALFYVREINHLIPSGQCQIDEIRCPAKLWERKLAQRLSGCAFQASRALPSPRFMIQTRQDIKEMIRNQGPLSQMLPLAIDIMLCISLCWYNHKKRWFHLVQIRL